MYTYNVLSKLAAFIFLFLLCREYGEVHFILVSLHMCFFSDISASPLITPVRSEAKNSTKS